MLVNVYATARQVPSPDFPHRLLSRRDRGDPELAAHLHGFRGYVLDCVGGEMSAAAYHLWTHIGRVQHHLALEVEGAHEAALIRWATEANAVLFLPDGTVCAPDLRPVLTRAGQQRDGAPHPPDAIARRGRVVEALAARGIQVPPSLPPVVGEPELHLREPEEVARRALALLVVALRAESLARGAPLPAHELRERAPVGFAALSPAEAAFFGWSDPPRHDVVQLAWRYEALNLLAWALDLVPGLPYPATICDVPALVRAVHHPGEEALVSGARLRPNAEILDALDLHFRLHWAINEARRLEAPLPAGIVGGVVVERHVALNWLVHHEYADWDDVDAPT